MTQETAAPAKPPRERGRLRRLALRAAADGAGFALSLLAIGGVALFGARRETARQAAEDWLQGQGVPAAFELQTLSPGALAGTLRLGDPDDPDLTVRRVEIVGDVTSPWAGGAFGFQPTAIRLSGANLRVRTDGRTFSFGALDPLVDQALRRPASDGPSPAILLEDATMRVVTPAGTLRLRGDGGVAEERLRWADLQVDPTRLAGGGNRLTIHSGAVSVRTRGDQVSVSGRGRIAEAASADAVTTGVVISVAGALPYPDTRSLAMDGPLTLSARVTAAAVRAAGRSADALSVDARLAGRASGDLRRPTYSGSLIADVRADGATAEGGAAERPRLRADLSRLSLSVADGWRLGSAGRVRFDAASVRQGDLRAIHPDVELRSADLRVEPGDNGGLRPAGAVTVTARAAGLERSGLEAVSVTASLVTSAAIVIGETAPVQVAIRAGAVTLRTGVRPLRLTDVTLATRGKARAGDRPLLDLRGSLSAASSLPATEARRLATSTPLLGQQPGYADALAGALRNARLEAPDLRLFAEGDRLLIALPQPVTARSASGATLTLAEAGGPLLRVRGDSAATASVSVRLSGGGLPTLTADVRDGRLTASGVRATLTASVGDLNIAPLQGIAARVSGSLRADGRAVVFASAGCTDARIAKVELGENDLAAVAGRVCANPAAPLFATTSAGWRTAARVEALSFDVPALQVRARDVAGSVQLAGGPAGANAGGVTVSQAVIADTAEVVRFEPLGLTGDARVDARLWRGEGVLRARGGVELAQVLLVHIPDTGAGGLTVSAPDLRFEPDSLQPGDISPLAATLVRNAAGPIGFEGRLEWDADAASSWGTLTVRDLDFRSPAGPVRDLSGVLELTSLAPIVSAPAQRFTAAEVTSLLPLRDVNVDLQIIDESLRVSGGTLQAGGGRVTLERIVIPFADTAPVTGSVLLAGVNVGAVFETTDFADRVRIDAPVSGRVPFEVAGGRLRLAGVQLASDRAGRIAISRAVLTGVNAAGGPDAPVNAVQDFAYQALENLAYDDLDLTLATDDAGKLNLRFGVRGRHDPPERTEARVPLLDLLRGTAFQRRIPLPSGTGVNLTLDTSLNLDELLAAYAAMSGTPTRSEPVQPPAATARPTLEGGAR